MAGTPSRTGRTRRDNTAKLAEELKNDLQRVQAEFANYKKRVESEREAAVLTGLELALKRLLPAIDSLERAVGLTPKQYESEAWAKGVSAVHKQFNEAAADLGLAKIEAEGREFDPHLMEAVTFEDGKGKRELVSEVVQTGYTLNGRVLRPAMVKVKKQ
jgi:molecular chaperone GrpE